MDALPQELLLQIIKHLGPARPPSEQSDSEMPDVNSLFTGDAPLKNLSSVSQLWRLLTLPLLFQNLRVHLRTAIEAFEELDYQYGLKTGRTPQSLQFLTTGSALSNLAKSAVIFERDETAQTIGSIPKALHRSLQQFLTRVLRNVSRVSVIAPPQSLALLLDCEVSMSDAWAFQITYQRIDMIRSTTIRPHGIRGIEEKYLLASQFWDSISFHGHSCLPSYGTYHYFEKYPPCPFTATSPSIIRPFPGYIIGYNVVDFSYSVLFPHVMHFRSVLHQLSLHFHKLARFSVRLAPDPNSALWQDLDRVGRGSLNLRDCWSEIENCHDELIKKLLPGVYALKAVTRVTIHDAQIPTIASQLDAKFARLTRRWEKQELCTWERSSSESMSHTALAYTL